MFSGLINNLCEDCICKPTPSTEGLGIEKFFMKVTDKDKSYFCFNGAYTPEDIINYFSTAIEDAKKEAVKRTIAEIEVWLKHYPDAFNITNTPNWSNFKKALKKKLT
jgi:hypothetical protein